MSFWWFAVAACLAAADASTTVGTALHGTTRLGTRPEPHAVVWLDVQDPSVPSDAARVVLDQRNLDFSPNILVVQVGTTVDFPNHDRVFHNVFSFHDGKKFDLGLYPVGTRRKVRFDHAGLSRIFCNIHPNMAAYVMAVPTPYFGLSDGEGHFEIASVPPGSYTYHSWRPGRPELTGTIVVGPGATLDVRWP
jgi:plastocyanin